MRYLLPALVLASAVALFAAVPVAGAQYGGATMPPLGPQPSGPVGPEAQLTAAPPGGPSDGTTTYTCAYGQVLPFSILGSGSISWAGRSSSTWKAGMAPTTGSATL